MTPSPCPHCGCTMFKRVYSCRGQWVQMIELKGTKLDVFDTFTDDLRNGPEPRRMTCADCGKSVPNPDRT